MNRFARNMQWQLAIASLLGVFAGCMFLPLHVERFSLESASLVNVAQEPRFTAFRSVRERRRFDAYFLKIRVRTMTNLAELASKEVLNLWVKAWRCSSDESTSIGTLSEVWYRDARVGHIDIPPQERAHAASLLSTLDRNEIKTYHLYLELASALKLSKNSVGDVCVRVGGGGLGSTGFQSNIIVIPQSAIEAALLERH